jgi:hypothetical protein
MTFYYCKLETTFQIILLDYPFFNNLIIEIEGLLQWLIRISYIYPLCINQMISPKEIFLRNIKAFVTMGR